MVFAGDRSAGPADGLDPLRLAEVLRQRGGEVEELDLAANPGHLLDCLQAGMLPLVFDSDRGGST